MAQNAIRNKLENQSVVLKANNVWYHISLSDMAGNAAQLEQGAIRILLAYPEGMGAQDTFAVYHLKDNGKIEVLPVQLSAKGIVIETTGFSDFVVSYDTVQAAASDDVKTADMAHTLPYAAMLLAAFGCMALTAVSKKRKIK